MKKVLYAKYNRTRSPQFQTKIEIVEIDGIKQVIKTALTEAAVAHVQGIAANCEKYADYYNHICLGGCAAEGNQLVCQYIEGNALVADLESKLGDTEALVEELKSKVQLIRGINPKYYTEFVITEEFKTFFGVVKEAEDYQGKALTVCNLDSVFSNFIETSEGTVAIDCEWMAEVTIPESFPVYRAVKMFYLTNLGALSKQYEEDIFLELCGISKREQALFRQMDEGFQQYVHEENRRAIYTDRYRKPIMPFAQYVRNQELTNQHVQNLENVIADLRNTIEEQRRWSYLPKRCVRGLKKATYKILPYNVIRSLQVLRHEGPIEVIRRIKRKLVGKQEYEQWIKGIEKERAVSLKGQNPKYQPLISVLVPVYNVKPELLKACINSVVNQSYTNWQLCLADDCSTMPEVAEVLKQYESNPRIDVVYRKENGHISRATNAALEIAKGEYVALLDCDDMLTKHALLEMVLAINEHPEAKFLYSDEDKIDEESKLRFEPFFKPDWSPDTMMSLMYTCHFSVFQKSVIEEVGGLRVGFEGAQDYDLVLRVMEVINAKEIIHVPQILYHWRTRKESTASAITAKPYVMEATVKAKKEALERRGLRAKLELIEETSQYRVNYIPDSSAKVSVVIPSKDNPDILKRCIESLVRRTGYTNYEICIVDNGSSEANKKAYESLAEQYGCMYYYEPMEFNFSKMCNLGVERTSGEYILFLNDDMEIIQGEWMERMLGQAQLSHAGAVGAKLYYPKSTKIQHCGVLNLEVGPSHALCGYDDTGLYYMGINKNDTNYLAVTAACLMVNRAKFVEVGGFEETLRVAYNDVDLCFKLREAGYYNVVRNDVILYHYESYSRGIDTMDEEKTRRLTAEREKLYERHPDFSGKEGRDPFYSYRLVQNNVDYSLNKN